MQSIYTIAIGSVGSDSQPAFYDERCSAKLASTFVHNPFSGNLSVVSRCWDGGGGILIKFTPLHRLLLVLLEGVLKILMALVQQLL